MTARNRATAIDTGAELARLEENLRHQLEGHRELLACVRECREAVRRVDMDAVCAVCERENAVAQRLAELEKSRLGVVARLTEALEPRAEAPLALARITESADEPARSRLTTLAGQLRAAVEDVRGGSAVVRRAAEALSRHMTGLLQTVNSALGRAGVYGRRGRLETGGQQQFRIDLKS